MFLFKNKNKFLVFSFYQKTKINNYCKWKGFQEPTWSISEFIFHKTNIKHNSFIKESISEEQWEHLINLTKLSLSKEKKNLTQLQKDFQEILFFIKKIQEIPTDSIKPLHCLLENQKLYLREDNLIEEIPVEDILKNSKTYKNYFIVPKIQEILE